MTNPTIGLWTPGPWRDNLHAGEKRDGGRYYVHVFAKSASVVPIACVPTGVEGYGREEGRANARLIAAAPKLYEALRGALELLEGDGLAVPKKWTAALAEARGETE